MFDYTHVMTARKEYEQRNNMHQDESGAGISMAGPLHRSVANSVANIGDLLVKIGRRLQAHRNPMHTPIPGASDIA